MSELFTSTEVRCQLCGKQIIRSKKQQDRCKSKFFYCSVFCKNVYRGAAEVLYGVPKDNPIFKAVEKAYSPSQTLHPEYLIEIVIIRMDKKYEETFGHFLITGTSRINGVPQLSGKTPQNIEYIKKCFNGISIDDINNLPEIQEEDLNEDWKTLHLKWWNPNDITYTIDY